MYSSIYSVTYQEYNYLFHDINNDIWFIRDREQFLTFLRCNYDQDIAKKILVAVGGCKTVTLDPMSHKAYVTPTYPVSPSEYLSSKYMNIEAINEAVRVYRDPVLDYDPREYGTLIM